MALEWIDWLFKNKEWVFSGIGIFVITATVSIIKFIFRKKEKTTTIIKQNNNGTDNTQIGIQNNYGGKGNE